MFQQYFFFLFVTDSSQHNTTPIQPRENRIPTFCYMVWVRLIYNHHDCKAGQSREYLVADNRTNNFRFLDLVCCFWSQSALGTKRLTLFSRSLMIPRFTVWSFMMTSSNGNISVLLALCEGNPPATGGFPLQRPVTQSFCVFLCASEQTTKHNGKNTTLVALK